MLAGLAPDGGLYVPEVWPLLSQAEIAGFAGLPYAQVAARILGLFAGDSLSAEELTDITAEAYAGFTHAAVTPLRQLDPGLWLLELFHGPTLAFKDVAMQLLSRLYEHALEARKRSLTVVCATSGDTGGAAVEALRGRAHVRLVVLFPEGKISEVQRRFMTTAGEANVRCIAVDGSFDDCQAIVKGLFNAQGFPQSVDLSGVNSINWARIAAQVVYYFTAAVALGAPHRPVSFAVPTGNFGDGFAGYVAARMGLPIERIIVATNSNDILAKRHGDRPLRPRRGGARPRARPWTSRSPPTSSGCTSTRSTATGWKPAAPCAPSPTMAPSTSRPRPSPGCASCSSALGRQRGRTPAGRSSPPSTSSAS